MGRNESKVKQVSLSSLEGSSGKLVDPHLSISGESIPYTGDKPVKFLGLEIQVPPNRQRAREIVRARLKDMLHRQLPHHHPPEATGLPGSSLSSAVVAADGAGISPNMGEEHSGSTSDSSPEEVVRPR